MQWDQGPIKGLGWSDEEQLLAVTEDGTVRVYEGLQADFVPFSIGHVGFTLPESWTSTDTPRAPKSMVSYRVASGRTALSRC